MSLKSLRGRVRYLLLLLSLILSKTVMTASQKNTPQGYSAPHRKPANLASVSLVTDLAQRFVFLSGPVGNAYFHLDLLSEVYGLLTVAEFTLKTDSKLAHLS